MDLFLTFQRQDKGIDNLQEKNFWKISFYVISSNIFLYIYSYSILLYWHIESYKVRLL